MKEQSDVPNRNITQTRGLRARPQHAHTDYPTRCPLVRFSHIASKMLRATSPNQVLTHAARAAARRALVRATRDGPCAHGKATDNKVAAKQPRAQRA